MTAKVSCKIPIKQLKKKCNIEKELKIIDKKESAQHLGDVIGQERGVEAMEFGLTMEAPGYNIFVSGQPGTGKNSYTKEIVAKVAKDKKSPDDWCYLNNFNNSDQPIAVSLPSGRGKIFKRDMEMLVENLISIIPKAFESRIYLDKKENLFQLFKKKIDDIFKKIEDEAKEVGFDFQQAPPRFVLIPIIEGKPIHREEYEVLSEMEREIIDEKGKKLGKSLDEAIRERQLIENKLKDEIIKLEKNIAYSAAESQITALKKKYSDLQKIMDYLEDVLNNIGENHFIFNTNNLQKTQNALSFMKEDVDDFLPYRVNLFISNGDEIGAPIILEPNPYYYNLFGKIEYRNQIFAVNTDFTMIKPGAIHSANGGYLILQIIDLLRDPFSWGTLIKTLKYQQAIVENIGEQYRLVPMAGLKPEPIPLNLKVILIGNPYIFEILYEYDEDFKKLFKVKVDFDVNMPRNEKNLYKYVSFINKTCKDSGLKNFEKSAIEELIEYSSRIAGTQDKLSTRFNIITDLIFEAEALSREDKVETVNEQYVEKAISNYKNRLDKIENKILEQMILGNIKISTEGEKIGQVNGLSVLEISGYAFGIPSRITARTYAGNEGIIHIERETEMSGNIHSKGVLTLTGFLGGKFAQKKPMGLTAQITFEQSYSEVEGDSASSAELYAVVSSLADAPLNQSIAVTGSVDQMGEIQPIGGVNQKIEGFFKLCKSKGLTGEQGVIIPVQNIKNLMLTDEVIEAVKQNKFSIYGIKNIEEGIEILTGISAGVVDKEGKYPENTVFYNVEKKLQSFNKSMFGRSLEAKKMIKPL